EIPARFLGPALEQLRELAARGLEERRIAYGDLRTLGTPRRLVLYVRGLAEGQTPVRTRVKGPARRVAFDEGGRPTAAAEGFARNQGVRVEDLVVENVGQVEYVFAVKEEGGRPTREVLAELAPELIAGLHFPKPMRWGDLDFSFIRPIRWLLALLGPEVVPFGIAGLTSGRTTFGHRLLSKGPITVADPDDYFRRMRAAFVLVDPEERRAVIREQVRAAAA
ncbi:MAG: glycine--tRNA ligase subunit beta, partial [Firmicutes bacterium]|nr:glycine--tRNA ligase subunit beta [Bacillota bacterium]